MYFCVKKSKVEYDKSIEMIPPDRTISYIQRLFCMKQYIGDMRIYDWFKVVKDKYISASNTKQSCIEKYGKKSLRIITELNFLQLSLQLNIPWWRSHPIHENRATESICTEPCNP